MRVVDRDSVKLEDWVNSKHDCIITESESMLACLVMSETKIGCPEVILMTFNTHGQLITIDTFSRQQFVARLKKQLAIGQAYIALTRFKNIFS